MAFEVCKEGGGGGATPTDFSHIGRRREGGEGSGIPSESSSQTPSSDLFSSSTSPVLGLVCDPRRGECGREWMDVNLNLTQPGWFSFRLQKHY